MSDGGQLDLTIIAENEPCMLCGSPVGGNKLVLQAYANGEVEVTFQLCDTHSRMVGEAMMEMSPLARVLFNAVKAERGWLG